MQDISFGDPGVSTGDRLSCEEVENKRLIIRPVEYIPSMMTVRGEATDAIKVNVVVLEDQTRAIEAPKLFQEVLWFGGFLIKAFKRSLGTPFVGYIAKGRTPQGYRPWEFINLNQDPATVDMAKAWINENPTFMDPLPPPVPRAAFVAPDAHHEQGAPPPWAGVTPPAPATVPFTRSAPPPATPPVPISSAQMSVLDRLRQQGGRPTETAPDSEVPF